MKKIVLIIASIASISISCNKVNLSQDEAKELIVQSLHLPFIFRFDIEKRASFNNDFAVYGLYKAGLTTGGDYYPGQIINIQPTELGKSSYLGDSGNAYMFKTNDIVFIQITGISVNKDQQTATIRFTLKANNVTLAGYALAKAQGNLNGDKCIVYSLTRPLNGELTYKKFDTGWQLATDENKSSLDLLNQLLKTSENSNRQDDYTAQINSLTAEVQAKEGKVSSSQQEGLMKFWSNFKSAITNKDYKKITELTYFPFLQGDGFMNPTNFDAKSMFQDKTSSFATTNPVLNGALKFNTWGNGNSNSVPFDSHSYASVNINGSGGYPSYIFASVNGEYKFIGIDYGE